MVSTRGVPQPFARNVLVGLRITLSLSEDDERKIHLLAVKGTWEHSIFLDMSGYKMPYFKVGPILTRQVYHIYHTRDLIIADPDNMVLFTKAAIALHNYLRFENAATYCPTGFVAASQFLFISSALHLPRYPKSAAEV